MVSALCRHLENEVQRKKLEAIFSPAVDGQKIDSYPCALRDFINSNSDLPTIEELVKYSAKIAQAVGQLH